jgi:hypothetical protein
MTPRCIARTCGKPGDSGNAGHWSIASPSTASLLSKPPRSNDQMPVLRMLRGGIPRVDFKPVRVVRVSGAALTSGIEEQNVDGVRVTSSARTVVDCFKFRHKIGVDVAVEALRYYRRLCKGTVDELWHQADRLRMTRVIRPYCERYGPTRDLDLLRLARAPLSVIDPAAALNWLTQE